MNVKSDLKKRKAEPRYMTRRQKQLQEETLALTAAAAAPSVEIQTMEGYLPAAVWSHVFLFMNLKDISVLSRVSKEWNAALELAGEQELWESLFAKQCPRLANIVKEYYNEEPNCSKQWKPMLKTRLASPYEPHSLNTALQKDLETIFSPLGITAFSNCCNNCTRSYADFRDFRLAARSRDMDPKQCGRIHFFKLFLSGMNYHDSINLVPACYSCWDCVDKKWESECKLVDLFCAVLGLQHEDYTIEKPESIKTCVMNHFKKPFTLEAERWEGDEEDEEEDIEYGEDEESED